MLLKSCKNNSPVARRRTCTMFDLFGAFLRTYQHPYRWMKPNTLLIT